MTLPKELQRLIDDLGMAVSAPPAQLAQEATAALRVSVTESNWLAPERRRASHDRYARHLLYGDPGGRFSILEIVWDHGQMSPIHAHHTWCAVGVYSGVLTENFYRENTGGAPVLLRTMRRTAGMSSFDPPLSAVHRIANESGALAVSLHVYGVGKDHIPTGVNRVLDP